MIALRAVCFGALFGALAAATEGSPGACAPCHRAQTGVFAQALMSRALETGRNSQILRENPKLSVKLGGYSYEIARSGDEFIYSVTDGKETIRVPVEWSFGQGAAGQTYVFQREGKWYESRVSYYAALRGLDLTMGHPQAVKDLTEAVGRVTQVPAMRLCFQCHATNVPKSGPLVFDGMVEGVQCERCHGPSEEHLASGSDMKKLGALSTEQQSDFCGQCHRTWEQISMNGPHDIGNVRFQPYRLANSRCYDAADSRIKCTACHDPHRPVETRVSAYDAKCMACHARGAKVASRASGRLCKVASANCASCHMPRLDLPGAHQKFTDHRIRIARANEPYPD